MISPAKLPKHTQKRIYWNKDGIGGTGFILIGYCPDSLPYFLAMAELAKRNFEDANIEDSTCGKITNSRTIKGFTLFSFKIDGNKRKVKGWADWTNIGIDFGY